jgi:hypothetical protein
MPFDWDAIDKDIKDASKATDDQLASRVSSVTSLKDDEIKALFPSQGDVQKLAQLMAIVNDATAENERANALAANIKQLAPVAVRLLKHFA